MMRKAREIYIRYRFTTWLSFSIVFYSGIINEFWKYVHTQCTLICKNIGNRKYAGCQVKWLQTLIQLDNVKKYAKYLKCKQSQAVHTSLFPDTIIFLGIATPNVLGLGMYNNVLVWFNTINWTSCTGTRFD